MLMGHYATALVAYERNHANPKNNLPLFLVAAQFLDLLMLFLVSVGIETFLPHSIFEASFANMRTDMYVTHDLVPVLGWSLGFALAVWAALRDSAMALWCLGLNIVHEASDLLVGFSHNVLGPDSPKVGLQLYTVAPTLGLIVEILLCLAIVFWFANARKQRNRPLRPQTLWGLHGILAGGTVAMLPIANHSLNELWAIVFG
jgi:hypothetical protein